MSQVYKPQLGASYYIINSFKLFRKTYLKKVIIADCIPDFLKILFCYSEDTVIQCSDNVIKAICTLTMT